ncbi:MAG: hypothetical protein ACTSQE_14860 [Candidatus Heimdallarchaeaceae archaeon]
MSRGRNKDYSKEHRDRYNKNFQQAYGMAHKDWAKWKKNHTKAEIQEKRAIARVIKERSY